MPKRRREALDYFRFDAVAWLTSPEVIVMTAAQEGAFIRLLAIASRSKDCTLPNNEDKLALLSKLGSEWLTVGVPVRAQWDVDQRDPSKLFNEKLRAEWKEAWSGYKSRCKRNRENALKRVRVASESHDIGKPVDATKGTGTGEGTGTVVVVTTPEEPALASRGAGLPLNGDGKPDRRKYGGATLRELQNLETDPRVVAVGDAWVSAFRRPRREIGVLRAAVKALAGGYEVDAIALVVRVAGRAVKEPERFMERSSFRWTVEHSKLAPDYLLRAETLDRLMPEAEAFEREDD